MKIEIKFKLKKLRTKTRIKTLKSMYIGQIFFIGFNYKEWTQKLLSKKEQNN